MHRSDGFPPPPLFAWDHHGMHGGRDEIGLSYEGSSEVSRSIGFVVRGPGESTRGTIDEKETKHTPKMPIVQLRCFIYKTPSCH
jgi:hypothetical protein